MNILREAVEFLLNDDFLEFREDEETVLQWEYLFLQVADIFDEAGFGLPKSLLERWDDIHRLDIAKIFGDNVEEI